MDHIKLTTWSFKDFKNIALFTIVIVQAIYWKLCSQDQVIALYHGKERVGEYKSLGLWTR